MAEKEPAMKMKRYYVNTKAQPDSDDHEVHEEGCSWFKLVEHPYSLGEFAECAPAVAKALRLGYKADGCEHCSAECHTQ